MSEEKLIEGILDDINQAMRERQDYQSQWDEVDAVISNKYKLPSANSRSIILSTDETIGEDFHVKSHMLYKKRKKMLANLSFPADFQYNVTGVSQTDSTDEDAATIAKSVLTYFWQTQDWWKKFKKSISDTICYHRGYMRSDFRTEDEIRQANNRFGTHYQGNQHLLGQPYIENIPVRDFLMMKGFASLKDAEDGGGAIFIRTWPLLEWVKKNKTYSEKARRKIEKADATSKSIKTEEGDPKSEEDEILTDDIDELFGNEDKDGFLALWECFYAPTPKYPMGRYFVINRQYKQILYRHKEDVVDETTGAVEEIDSLPEEDRIFPVRDLCFNEVDDKFYAESDAHRALDAQFAYEIIQGKIFMLIDAIKKGIILDSKEAAEYAVEQIENQDVFFISYSEDLQGTGNIQPIDIDFDITNLRQAALEQEARFDELFSIVVNLASPRASNKIATEMQLNKQDSIKEANMIKIIINLFAEDVAWDIVNLSEQMSYEEQIRITRNVEGYFANESGSDIAKGRYNIEISTSDIIDMTFGDKINADNMLLTNVTQLKQMPEYNQRLDALTLVKDMAKDLGHNPLEFDKGDPQRDQKDEIDLLLLNLPIPVLPSDNHLQHAMEINNFLSQVEQLQMQAENDDRLNMEIPENGMQMIIQHLVQHYKLGEEQNQGSMTGAWQQTKNIMNNARSAQGNVSSLGASRVQSGANQFQG
jgi:hypothetical protein